MPPPAYLPSSKHAHCVGAFAGLVHHVAVKYLAGQGHGQGQGGRNRARTSGQQSGTLAIITHMFLIKCLMVRLRAYTQVANQILQG